MASLFVRRNNQWLGFAVPTTLTVINSAPSASGQTFAMPFTFGFDTTDNPSVNKVELYYMVAGSPVYLAETASFTAYGWLISLPLDFTPGTYVFFGRAYQGSSFTDGPFITTTITAAAASLGWFVPSSNGQSFTQPFTAALSASDASQFSSVTLYRTVGGVNTAVGSTSTYGVYGFAIDASSLATGTHTIFGRGTRVAGGTTDSPTRTVTIATTTTPGTVSLKEANYYGGEDSHWTEAQSRMGYKLSGRMRFVVRATPTQCISDFTNQIDSVIARRNTDRYMMWLTVGLVMNNDDGGLAQTANGSRNSSLWVPIGQQLNRLTADDLTNLVGLRLGHEFMNAGDDYRWGVRNTTTNSTNVLTNASNFRGAWSQAWTTMTGQLSSQAKKDALQLDFNAPGGQMIRTMTHSGTNAWTLADACRPALGQFSHVTADIYNQERFRSNHSGPAPYVPINGPDSPLAWVTSRAIQWGKRSGMSEGSAFMFKFKSGVQIGADDGAVTVKFVNDALDWLEAEIEAGRRPHWTWFERDPYNEGFTAFIGGQRDTSARATGEERTWDLWRLLHPREAKTGGGFIPGGIPAGVTGVPNTLSRRASVHTAIGGPRTASKHSNAPQALNALLARVNP